jgi:ligand-binding SRPBCC domain-containing protein
MGEDMARSEVEIEVASTVGASRDAVWAVVSTMDGVNAELAPFVRMTHPDDRSSLADGSVVPGELVFRSWLLAFGVVPFDRHALVLDRVDAGRGFVEESTSWVQRRWRHERTLVDAAGGGTTVTDRLVVRPRVALARPVVGAIVGALFRHRHRRLRRRFGTR